MKHLEFIENVISRMSNNSFFIKGWAITVTSILTTINISKFSLPLLWIVLGVFLFFWILDSVFIYEERGFVALYKEICLIKNDADITFNMEAPLNSTGFFNGLKAFFSKTLLLFYPPMMILLGILYIYAQSHILPNS